MGWPKDRLISISMRGGVLIREEILRSAIHSWGDLCKHTQVPGGGCVRGEGREHLVSCRHQPWSLGSILYTVLTTTRWAGCCCYSHFSNKELTLREGIEENKDKGATQTCLEL